MLGYIGSVAKMLYSLTQENPLMAAGISVSTMPYIKSLFNTGRSAANRLTGMHNRTLEDLPKIAEELQLRYDPRSSASRSSITSAATERYPNSQDTAALADLFNQSDSNVKKQNNLGAYDGSY